MKVKYSKNKITSNHLWTNKTKYNNDIWKIIIWMDNVFCHSIQHRNGGGYHHSYYTVYFSPFYSYMEKSLV